MKLLISVLSVPFIFFARITEWLNVWEIRADISRCLEMVDSLGQKVPSSFLVSLIAAEDHRNALHQGVDPIAMVRAAYVRIRCGKIQGASTIEQQFVRVVSGRYEKKIGRKVREQILAISVSRRTSKLKIASAYLSIAFYGSKCIGAKALRDRCGNHLACAEQNDIWGMIARLKYPEPLKPSSNWERKLNRRIEHISYCERRSANKRSGSDQAKPA